MFSLCLISFLELKALQILYSGSVNGTYIAKNATVDSNHRGIAIEGSSDVYVYDNVAVNVSGHAFYIGDQSQNNVLERNLGSQTKSISQSNTTAGENDYDAAAFRLTASYRMWHRGTWSMDFTSPTQIRFAQRYVDTVFFD